MRLPTGTIDLDSSPSFSGMLIEAKNRPDKPPGKRACSPELNFQFTQMSSPSSPFPADILFANGQLVPQSLLQNNSKTNSPRVSRDSSSNSSYNTSRRNSSSSSSDSNSNNSSNKTSNFVKRRVPLSLDGKVSNSRYMVNVPDRAMNVAAPVKGGKKKKKQRQGLFGSFMAACRQCHALEPSKQVVADNILAI